MDREKRKAQLKVAYLLLEMQYGPGRKPPQLTEELTTSQHHYLQYMVKNGSKAILRNCPGCGAQVDHFGDLDERPHACQLCSTFPGRRAPI